MPGRRTGPLAASKGDGVASSIVAQAMSYVDRGWAVIPVWAGQAVPIEKDWPLRARRTRADVETTWAAHPTANIGIVTGAASGFWVLDIDVQHGGDVALSGLVQAYGRLPETYTVGTPHGGMHYYFVLPDFEPTNRVGTGRAGGLPKGIDVRGRGGQVVAPPSVRDGRPYTVLLDAAVSAAPEWLVDMLRPATGHEGGPEASPPVSGLVGGTGQPAPPNGSVGLRGPAYAQSAMGALWSELANSTPGSRNHTAYRVACRMQELANSPWAALDPAAALPYFVSAARAANGDGTFPEHEALACWASAARNVGGRGVALPATDMYGATVALPADFGRPATDYAPATSVAGGTDQGAAPGPDPIESAISTEVMRLWVRQQAQDRLRRLQYQGQAIEVLDEEEMDTRPLPEPLVENWLYEGQVARLFGPPGGGKTFVAVDLAASVATGRPWHGLRVRQAGVVYVAAEDPVGVALRARAWRQHNEIERHGIVFVPVALQMDDDGAARLRAALAGREGLGLIVFDTQAMVTVGMDEDSAQQMGVFVRTIKQLAKDMGVAILIVHHSGVSGGRGRGSTAMDGAMDTEIEASLTGSTVKLTHKKAKNTMRQRTTVFALHQVILAGEADSLGSPVSSCVLLAAGDRGTAGELVTAGGVTIVAPFVPRSPEERAFGALVECLRREFAAGVGGTKAEVRKAFLVHDAFSSLSTGQRHEWFNRAWGRLTELGRLGRNPIRETFKFVEIEGAEDFAPNPGKLDEHGYAMLGSS